MSLYDNPELWLKENSEQVRSALGDTSGLLPRDLLGHCLFPVSVIGLIRHNLIALRLRL